METQTMIMMTTFTFINDLVNTTENDTFARDISPTPVAPAFHYFMGVMIVLIGFIGLIQNSLILFVIRGQKVTKRNGYFTQALMANDLAMCVLSLPFAAVSSFARRWLFGSFGCNWYGFSMCLLGYFNIHLLTAISIERYITVMGQHTSPIILSKRAIGGIILACLLLSLFWSLLPLFGISSYVPEGVGTSCGISWSSRETSDITFCILLLIFCFVIPLAIIVGCYSKIYFKVKSVAWSQEITQQSQVVQRRIQTELHLAKMIFFASGSFLLVWSPYAIASLIHIFSDSSKVNPIFFSLPAIFAKCSAFGNSLVYICMNRRLREVIIQKCKSILGILPTAMPMTPVPGAQGVPMQPIQSPVSVVGLQVGPARDPYVK